MDQNSSIRFREVSWVGTCSYLGVVAPATAGGSRCVLAARAWLAGEDSITRAQRRKGRGRAVGEPQEEPRSSTDGCMAPQKEPTAARMNVERHRRTRGWCSWKIRGKRECVMMRETVITSGAVEVYSYRSPLFVTPNSPSLFSRRCSPLTQSKPLAPSAGPAHRANKSHQLWWATYWAWIGCPSAHGSLSARNQSAARHT